MDLVVAVFGIATVGLLGVVLYRLHVVDRRARRRADEVLAALVGLREVVAARADAGPAPRGGAAEEDEEEQTRVMRPSEVAWAQQVFDERPTIPVVMGEEEEEVPPRRAALYPVVRESGAGPKRG